MTFAFWSHILLGNLTDASLRAVALAAIPALAVLCLRKRFAAMEHAIWTAVLAGMLLLPLLRPIAPSVSVPTTSAKVLKLAANLPAISSSPIRIAQPIPMVVRSADDPDPERWMRYISFLYLAGLFAFLARIIAGIVLTRRSLESVRTIRGETEVRALVAEGAMLTVQIAESDQVAAPLTAGWPEGVVILPLEWRSWAHSKLRMVLAHEAAHVNRRDSLITLIAAVNKAVFWFHPLAWFLERRLAACAELAADDAVLESGADAHGYADTLVEIAMTGHSRRLMNGIAMTGAGKIGQRIDRILTGHAGPSRIGMWTRSALCMSALLLAGAAVMLHVKILNAQQLPPDAQALRVNPAELQEAMDFLRDPHEPGDMSTGAHARAVLLEQNLAKNPEDLSARLELCGLYLLYGAEDRRLPLIYWLIEHHPEFRGFALGAMRVLQVDGPAGNAAGKRAVALWRTEADAHPMDVAVLENAAFAMDNSSDQVALLRRAFALDPKPQRGPAIPVLYSWVLTEGSRCKQDFGDELCDPLFAESVRLDLASSSDPALLGAVGYELIKSAATADLLDRTDFDFATARSMSLNLLGRASSLDPQDQDWRNDMEGFRRIPISERETR